MTNAPKGLKIFPSTMVHHWQLLIKLH